DDEYPEDTAIPLAAVTCAAGAITAIEDRRTYYGGEVLIELGGELPGSAGSVQSKVCAHTTLVHEATIAIISDGGSGATAGQTQFDIEVAGTSIFPSFADEDHRPAFAYDATGADLVQVDESIHEPTVIRRGQTVELLTIEHPTDGAPASCAFTLICRKP